MTNEEIQRKLAIIAETGLPCRIEFLYGHHNGSISRIGMPHQQSWQSYDMNNEIKFGTGDVLRVNKLDRIGWVVTLKH